jgi:hypothetical protein
MHGLETDVAFLPLRIVFARLDRDRDGLLVFFVGVVLFRVAAAVYFLTHLLVAAAPVVMLASGITVSDLTSNASRRVVGQWGGAGGAICEDHLALAGSVRVAAAAWSTTSYSAAACKREKPVLLSLLFPPAPRAHLFEGRSVRYSFKEINGTLPGGRKN